MGDEEQGDVQAAVQAGRDQVQVIPREEDDLLLVARPSGTEWAIHDLTPYRLSPRRATGQIAVDDMASFAAYMNAHAIAGSTVYVHADGAMVGVLNDHEGGGKDAGWRDHRVKFVRPLMRVFREWMEIEGKPLTQYEFSNFLEDHLPEIASPDGSDLLEMAQTFRAARRISVRSQQLLANGQTQVSYIEELEGGTDRPAGAAEQKLTVPTEFAVVLQPYRDVDPFQITARLRWGLREAAVHFTFRFPELQVKLEEIIEQSVEQVRGAVGGALVLRGTE